MVVLLHKCGCVASTLNSCSEFTDLTMHVTVRHACRQTPYVLSFGVFMCIVRRLYHNPTGDVNSSRRFVCTRVAAFVTNVVICQI